jgi:glyoxylase-like metal-dependent hydrolase (beta-lactamase superfamily II)
VREVIPGVLTWSAFSERFQYDFNGWWIDGIVVDPVAPDDEAELVRRGAQRIILTNRNHFRAAARVRELTGARVAVHPADAAFVREKGVIVDDELAYGERIGGFVVVDAHGKSPGEIALHWPERRLLLVGDACVSPPGKGLALLPPAVIDDLPALRQSLARLAGLDFDTLLVGDGVWWEHGGKAALQALVAGG